MHIDTQSRFSDAQALAGSLGAVIVSTNVLDTGAADNDSGHGEQGAFIELISAAPLTSAGAATVNVEVQTSNTEGSGYVTVVSTGAKSIAEFNAGLTPIPLPLGLKRYVRLQYTNATAAATGGTISAFLVKDIGRQFAYRIGST